MQNNSIVALIYLVIYFLSKCFIFFLYFSFEINQGNQSKFLNFIYFKLMEAAISYNLFFNVSFSYCYCLQFLLFSVNNFQTSFYFDQIKKLKIFSNQRKNHAINYFQNRQQRTYHCKHLLFDSFRRLLNNFFCFINLFHILRQT